MRERVFAACSRLWQFVRPGAADADFDEEIATHLAMAEDEQVRLGMSREEARRRARLELGGVVQLRDAARAARGLPWLDAVWLDATLGVRLLRKSWGLTFVGGLAMAVTIGLGASIFTVWNAFAGVELPLPDGDRIVAIQPLDRAAGRVQVASSLGDFLRWREALTVVEQVSAMRAFTSTVITRDGASSETAAAEMTASAFELARVRPLMGRTILAQDERDGAEPVAVVGYRLWQSVLGSDPAVVGQRIRIAGVLHTIVGVMPEGFRFPVRQRVWTALRTAPLGGGPDAESDVLVFARLAPGATVAQARAEVTTLGLVEQMDRSVRALREPRVVRYAEGVFPEVHGNQWVAGLLLLLGALLLVPPCANIAILVYARTVKRRDEFAARSALGASRARIVMQLFVEVLVLASIAGVAGFLLARQFTGRLLPIVMPGLSPQDLPFWMQLTPSLSTVLAVAGLSLMAAAIAGGAPALHATGRWRQSGLLHRLSGRTAPVRPGWTWTTLLAIQVALSVAILPTAIEMSWGIFRPVLAGPTLAVKEYLTASLVSDGDLSRFEDLRREAVGRLSARPGISGVTASAASLMEPPGDDIEIEGIEASGRAWFNAVDAAFFEVFDARLLVGRTFGAGDFGPAATPVVVNRTFATELLGGANPLGRRLRYLGTQRASPGVKPIVWYDIVGMVEDFPGNNDGPTVYHPLKGPVHPITLTIRAPSDLAAAAREVRGTLPALDPSLRVGRLRTLEEEYWQRRSLEHRGGFVIGTVTTIVLLLSMAGIYTMMAFIVAQRRHEIGLRAALGAEPRQLLAGIFGRALVPLVAGMIGGSALALPINSSVPVAEAGGQPIAGIVPASAALLALAGLLAMAGPAARALRVDPTEELRVS